MTDQQQVDVGGYTGTRTLGIGAWLAAWALLTAPQGYAIAQAIGAGGEAPLAAGLWSGLVVALQAVKAAVTVLRMRDLGRPSDDVVWALVPLLNVVLFFQALQVRPAEAARARRIRSWAGQTSAVGAFVESARWLAPTAWVGVFGAAVSALVAWLGLRWLAAFLAIPAEDAVGLRQGLVGVTGFLAIYTLVQVTKRQRASRRSWLPSLLLLPSLSLTAGLYLLAQGSTSAGLGIVALIYMSWGLLAVPWVGALLAGLWIVAADRHRRGEPTAPGAVLAELTPHTGGVVVAWGGRFQIVTIGMQVLVPGIWYAISFAFADAIALLRPERPPFSGSTELARGVRAKLFKILALNALAATALQLAVWTWFAGLAVATLAPIGFVDLNAAPPAAVILSSATATLVSWWATLAILVVFYERDALLARKQARQQATAEAGAPADATP